MSIGLGVRTVDEHCVTLGNRLFTGLVYTVTRWSRQNPTRQREGRSGSIENIINLQMKRKKDS
jgi:hypothetical protein